MSGWVGSLEFPGPEAFRNVCTKQGMDAVTDERSGTRWAGWVDVSWLGLDRFSGYLPSLASEWLASLMFS